MNLTASLDVSSSPASPIGLSLVIPSYNRGTLLRETLEAALAQSRPFAEIVVVDDGSTDGTAELVQRHAPRVRLIRTENQGVQAARNTGLNATQTPWVAFCDSDDLLHPRYAEMVAGLLESPAVADQALDALYCNFEIFSPLGSHGDKLTRAPHDFFQGAKRTGAWVTDIPDLYDRLLSFQPLFQSGFAVRRGFFETIGGYNTALRGCAGEDFEFTLRVAAHGRVAYCLDPLARVRKHASNDSSDSPRLHAGDAHVLAHAIAHHSRAPATQERMQKTLRHRLRLARAGYFAAGRFANAQVVDALLGDEPRGTVERAKNWIQKLPEPLRNWAWRLTQLQGRRKAQPALLNTPQSIAVLEPAWDGKTHLPGNIGLLRIVHKAYPQAQLHFVGGAEQLELLRAECPADVLRCTELHAWLVNHDRDAGPVVARAAQRRLSDLPDDLARRVDLLVFASCTATSLHAATSTGLASKCLSMLHGNAGELRGWRSRNPVLRHYDLTGALQRYVAAGGRTLVLEARIRDVLARDHQWLAPSLGCLPHPLLPEETSVPKTSLGRPFRVGFLGGATIAKGFPEFVELANQVGNERPGVFEFRAIGNCPRECAGLDQSKLARPAATGLPRDEFLREVGELDYLFTWHKDEYYGDAASGVVYDAVNKCIPVLGRHRAQLGVWKDEGRDVGFTFEDLGELIAWMRAVPEHELLARRSSQCPAMLQLQDELTLDKLGLRLRGLVSPLGH